MGAGIKVKQGGKEETSVNQLISGLISFVWLWETSRELAQEKVEFHKIMQTAVICMTSYILREGWWERLANR